MADAPLFQIDGLTIAAADRTGQAMVEDLSLTIEGGELHALLVDPNQTGSAMAAALLGSSQYPVSRGRILLRGDDITTWDTDVRARAGLFLAFANPSEVAGVTTFGLLNQAVGAVRGGELDVSGLRRSLIEWMERLDIDQALLDRQVNEGLPAIARQRNEILQAAVLRPELLIVDGTNTDLDPAAAESLANGIRTVRGQRPSLGTLAITHCQRLSDHLEPDHVHVMVGGRIVASGGPERAIRLETEGYGSCT